MQPETDFKAAATNAEDHDPAVIAALEKLRERGPKNKLQLDAKTHDLLHSDGLIIDSYEGGGYGGRVTVSAMTVKGERLLEASEGVDSTLKESEAKIAILRNGLKINKPYVPNVSGIGEDRTNRIVRDLVADGMLKEENFRDGMYQLEGVVLLAKGERELDRQDGIDPKAKDAEAKIGILRAALKANEPHVPHVKGMGENRTKALIAGLVADGMLKDEKVRGDFGTLYDGATLLAKGERALDLQDGIDPKAKDDEAKIGILRAALKANEPHVPHVKGMSKHRIKTLVAELVADGMLKDEKVRGDFGTLYDGAVLLANGERELDRQDGIDPAEKDKEWMTTLLKQGQAKSGRPFYPSVKGMGKDRLRAITDTMIENGLLKAEKIQEQFGSRPAASVTPKGLSVLEEQERPEVSPIVYDKTPDIPYVVSHKGMGRDIS